MLFLAIYISWIIIISIWGIIFSKSRKNIIIADTIFSIVGIILLVLAVLPNPNKTISNEEEYQVVSVLTSSVHYIDSNYKDGYKDLSDIEVVFDESLDNPILKKIHYDNSIYYSLPTYRLEMPIRFKDKINITYVA